MTHHPSGGELASSSNSAFFELKQQLDEFVTTQLSPEQQQFVRDTTISIRQYSRRRFTEDYTIGKQLLEIKPLFFHGQRKLFVFLASQETGLGESMADRVQRIARAFLPFEERRELHQLDRISAAALDRIAGVSVPTKAREAFLDLILSGATPTEIEVVELIRTHRSPQDIENSERFVRYSMLVSMWGSLCICEDNNEDFKFYLVDRQGVPHYFKHYNDLMSQYKAWRTEFMSQQFEQVKALISPHWSISAYPCPKLPYRVAVNCEIAGVVLSYAMGNPLTVEAWWYDRAKQWTEQKVEKLSAIAVEAITPEDIEPEAVSFDSELTPCCHNCDWHDPNDPSDGDGFIYCGFYHDTIQEERIYDMPTHCRRWRHPDAPPPLIKFDPDPAPSDTIPSLEPIQGNSESSKSAELPPQQSYPSLGSHHSTFVPTASNPISNHQVTISEIKHHLHERDPQELKELQAYIQELLHSAETSHSAPIAVS